MAMQVMCTQEGHNGRIETGMTTLRERNGQSKQFVDLEEVLYWMNRIAEIDSETTVHWVRELGETN